MEPVHRAGNYQKYFLPHRVRGITWLPRAGGGGTRIRSRRRFARARPGALVAAVQQRTCLKARHIFRWHRAPASEHFGGGGAFDLQVSTATYNGLLTELNHRFSSGLQFKAAYTWSKGLDVASGVTGADGGGGNRSATRITPRATMVTILQTERIALSSAAPTSYLWERDTFLRGVTGVADKVLSGWQVNAIVSASSGQHFNITTGANRSGNGDTTNPDRPSWNPAFTGPCNPGKSDEMVRSECLYPASGRYVRKRGARCASCAGIEHR